MNLFNKLKIDINKSIRKKFKKKTSIEIGKGV